MAHTVEPSVYQIARTRIDPHSVIQWLTSLGVEDDAISALAFATVNTDGEKLIESAGRRCYMSFQVGLNPNVQQIRTDIAKYLTNLLEKRDGSVLEHVYYTFAIENVSRVFTGEMNRHRAGMSISEGSMRFIRYTDIPYWVPTSIRKDETPITGPARISDYKEEASRKAMQRVFDSVEKEYAFLAHIWKEELAPEATFARKKEITSMMRRIIPMGVATGGVWTGNIRALRHIFEMRCSEFAEEEILLVATSMLNLMRESEPILFADFDTNEYGFSKPKFSKV